jgi:hypothetical protein
MAFGEWLFGIGLVAAVGILVTLLATIFGDVRFWLPGGPSRAFGVRWNPRKHLQRTPNVSYMDRRRVALLLVVAGVVCLPAPQYLGWAASATAPPAQTSQIYAADPIDLGNESDQKRFVDRHGDGITLADYQLTTRYDDETYRSPNATRRALRAAMANGSTTVSDGDVRADLRAIDAEYEFVHDSEAGETGYYRLAVEANGSTVRADPVSIGAVANATADAAPHYETLSSGEQRTVDNVLANSTSEDAGYRPRVNDPYVDELPTAIWKGDTLYSIYRSGHVDDFGPGFAGFVVGLGVAAVGVVFVVAGGGLYGYDRWIRP